MQNMLSFRKNPSTSIALLILIVGSLIYVPKLSSSFVDWDDPSLVVENTTAHGLYPSNLWRAFTSYDPELYIPLTLLSYQLDFTIGGLQPLVFHTTNLLLHLCNAILVSGIAFLLCKNRWIACVTGLLFVAHPLHTEAVMWVSARKDLLSSLFALLSTWTYIHYRQTNTHRLYAICIILFICGLLAKVSIVGLPLVWLLLDWLEQRIIDRRSLQKIALPIAISILFFVIAVVGKSVYGVTISPVTMLLLGAKATVLYVQHLFVPLHLAVLYPYTKEVSLLSIDFALPVFLLTTTTCMAAIAYKQSRVGIVMIGTVLMLLAPSFSNYLKSEGGDVFIGSDRYAYLASIAILMVVAWLLCYLRKRTNKYYVDAGVAAVVCTFSVLSFQQANTWANTRTLFEHVLAHYPSTAIAHHKLGSLYQSEGNIPEALRAYERALAIAPKASTYVNMAEIARRNSSTEQALMLYNSALSLDAENDDAYAGIGMLMLEIGQLQDALTAFEQAVFFNPNNIQALENLGGIYVAMHRYDDAIATCNLVLSLDPDNTSALQNRKLAQQRKTGN